MIKKIAIFESKQAGLLVSFVEGRAAKYVEPERRGVSKGDPIGFPLNKFVASLLCVTSFDLQRIASKAGVSYGLLRKWRTEADFKKTISKHIADFIGELETWITARLKQDEADIERIMSLPLKAMTKVVNNFNRLKDFSDAHLYGAELVTAIEANLFPTGVPKKMKLPDGIIFGGTERQQLCVQILERLQLATQDFSFSSAAWQKAWELHAAAALTVAMDKIAKPNRSEQDLKNAVFVIRGIVQELMRRSPYWE